MELISGNDSWSDEISVEEQFADMLSALGEQERMHGQKTLELTKHLRTHGEGPPPIAMRSHGHRVVFCPQNALGGYSVFAMSMLEDKFNIRWRCAPVRSPLPWHGDLAFNVRGIVQAALAVITAVRVTMADLGMTDEGPVYVNDAPPLQAKIRIDGNVMCPHCMTKFHLDDGEAWDESRHRLCQQRLELSRK